MDMQTILLRFPKIRLISYEAYFLSVSLIVPANNTYPSYPGRI